MCSISKTSCENKTFANSVEFNHFFLHLVYQLFISNYSEHEKLDGVRLVDNRPSTAEAPPIGKIHSFSKIAVTLEPLMGF